MGGTHGKIEGNGGLEREVLLSPESIERIYDIHTLLKRLEPVVQEIPKISLLMQTVSTAQTTMAAAAVSMASTLERAEKRYEKLEQRLEDVTDKAMGKGQVPLLSHYMTLVSAVMVTVLVVLYAQRQQLDASLTSIKVNTHVP